MFPEHPNSIFVLLVWRMIFEFQTKLSGIWFCSIICNFLFDFRTEHPGFRKTVNDATTKIHTDVFFFPWLNTAKNQTNSNRWPSVNPAHPGSQAYTIPHHTYSNSNYIKTACTWQLKQIIKRYWIIVRCNKVLYCGIFLPISMPKYCVTL